MAKRRSRQTTSQQYQSPIADVLVELVRQQLQVEIDRNTLRDVVLIVGHELYRRHNIRE